MPVSKDTSVATGTLRAKANERAERVRPIVERLQAEGITSHAALASELNRMGVASPRGSRWRGSSVASLLRRLAACKGL